MLGGSIVAGELLDVMMVSCVVIVLDTVEENTISVVLSETDKNELELKTLQAKTNQKKSCSSLQFKTSTNILITKRKFLSIQNHILHPNESAFLAIL